MPRICGICGKTYQKAVRYRKIRSVFNPVARHRQHPNLQWFRMPDGKRMLICTSCRKRLVKDISS
ncbi:MAG: L28 family ribosomal protein [Candidatus Pacebacteria bacterium]|nr:L28 family ribosomal protein [Candidatus Paceibacterota bacterium]MDD5722010.1 L28 family ribosomal protein [Candidatus Paceibacterota bacterium]